MARRTTPSAASLLVSKSEAARLLGVSRGRTIDRMIADGTMKTVLIGERQRIPRAEVERIAAEGEPRRNAEQPKPPRLTVRTGARRGGKTQAVADALAEVRAIKIRD